MISSLAGSIVIKMMTVAKMFIKCEPKVLVVPGVDADTHLLHPGHASPNQLKTPSDLR